MLPLLLQIEDCRKPIVMAIHGTAFGGGLELAMAGHYRVAAPGAQVGQPEVKLGIIPGAAGTQRLPRLAGVAKAVEMCADGNPIKAEEAAEVSALSTESSKVICWPAPFASREKSRVALLPKRASVEGKLGTPEQNAPIFAGRARNGPKKTARHDGAARSH